jgi:phosphonate transport system substrate-binding protein
MLRIRCLAVVLLVGCTSRSPATDAGPPPGKAPPLGQSYSFGYAPTLRLDEAAAWAKRLKQYLAARTGAEITPFIASSYRSLISALQEGRLPFAWVSPAVLVSTAPAARAYPLAKFVHWGRGNYHAALIVRADSPLRKISDLRGRRVGWVDPRSTSGYLFPRHLLQRAGIEPDRFFGQNAFLGGHARVVEAVLERQVDVGATYCSFGPRQEMIGSSWLQNFPARAQEIRVLDTIGPIPNDVIIASPSVPPGVAAAVQGAFLRMHEDPEGRAILSTMFSAERALGADMADYDKLAQIIDSIQGR